MALSGDDEDEDEDIKAINVRTAWLDEKSSAISTGEAQNLRLLTCWQNLQCG
jgi:hypothetical protein